MASGFPHWLRSLDTSTIPSVRGGLLAAAGTGLATWGLLTAVFAFPYMGVIPDDTGGVVRAVTPGGLVWRSGIRPGQMVVELEPPASPEEWQIITRDGALTYGANVRAQLDYLRELVPQTGLALAIGLLGLLAFARWPRFGGLLGLGAATGGLPALWASGDDFLVPIGALALPLLLAAYLAFFGPPSRPLRLFVTTAAVAVSVAWLVARASIPQAFDPVDSVRTPLVLLLWATVIATAVDWREIVRLPTIDRTNRFDLALLGLGLGALVGLSFLLQPTWPVVIAAVFVAILVYSRSRVVLLQAFDQLLMAPARERAAIAAAEEEKVRLARRIHDEPLQTLSGVIRRLEVQPASADDIEALRETARHLREVATELNPPVLDDLGLGPALSHLVDQAKLRGAIPVELRLSDATDYAPDTRLPAEVEVALFRIAQEALTNAEVHSGARSVRINATLSRDAAEIELLDDGVGITDGKVRHAQWGGHFGVSGMRHRADNISARLEIGDVRPRGTRVAISWLRQTP